LQRRGAGGERDGCQGHLQCNALVPHWLTVPRKFFRKYQSTLDGFRTHPMVLRFGGWLQHPALWCLSRRSVSGAVAIGLFAGLIPGPFQMLAALLLAVPLKKNVPVALIVTWYTNPFTIVPLYLVAYALGHFLLGMDGSAPHVQLFEMNWSDLWGSTRAFGAWLMSLGKPLAVGLPALAVILAALGYGAVNLAWRIYVVRAWRRRKRS
jgi:uncharacterized protein (DUF2062 family)